jgi:hypothetical protein
LPDLKVDLACIVGAVCTRKSATRAPAAAGVTEAAEPITTGVSKALDKATSSQRVPDYRTRNLPLIEKAKAMQVPAILQGESLTRLFQGIAVGALASMVIGFSWGGWVTGGTATKLAAEQADTAVVAALTPICVEKFLQNTDAKANLAALQKISSTWEQGDYLEKGGWATHPGATAADYHLARACAEKLAQDKTAVVK